MRRADDMITGVLQFVVLEAPGDGVQAWICVHADFQRQALARADIDGSVRGGSQADESSF